MREAEVSHRSKPFLPNVRLAVCVVLWLGTALFGPSHAAERVAEFRGERSTETAEFEVEAPFLVDWIVNSDYPQSMGITIALIDARTGTHAGNIVKTKYRGDGLRLVEESGRFRFKIDSSLTTWVIKVDQLTPKEAELYTPKNAIDF